MSKTTMTSGVLLDDGYQSMPLEQFQILGDTITYYMNCILNAKCDMNAVEIVDEYFEMITSRSFKDSITDEQHQSL